MSTLQWDDVRYFLELVRQGSLSATARVLGVEHTTVARRVSNLEQTLGLRLFDRLPKGWQATEEGRELLEHALQMEEDMLALQRRALGSRLLPGRVCVSAAPLLLNHFMLPRMNDFHTSHPSIELALVSERRNSDLSRGEADIAIRVGDPRQADLAARKLGEVAYGLYGLPDQITLPSGQRNYIGFDNSIATLPQKRWQEQRMAGEHCVMRCNDMLSMLQAAQQGWGLALLPCFLVPLTSPLHRLAIPLPAFSLPVYLVMHPDVRRAPRVRCTADYLIALFHAHTPVLTGQEP